MPVDRSLIGREYYVFRDSTHNLISIENPRLGVLLRSILDTAEFQRLRNVRQNGLGFLVYPSLETSRFSHSLGSFSVAKRVIEALQGQQPTNGEYGFPETLQIDQESADGFAIAAALHDIGHGPLSHSWEEIELALEAFIPGCQRSSHETVGAKLVQSEYTELGRLLKHYQSNSESYEAKVVTAALNLLSNKHHLRYLRPLLSGNLDIDRLDFIARDTRAAGVTYGQHDLDWLIRSMRFGRLPQRPDEPSSFSWVIAIDARKGLNALVQYLRARENMYGLVYLHKTVRAANAHLAAIFQTSALMLRKKKIKPENFPLLAYLKTGQWNELGMASVNDSHVWTALYHLASDKKSFVGSLAGNLLSRRLYKSREIGSETARALNAMIESGGLASRLRQRLPQFPELNGIPDKQLAALLLKVDEVTFDIIGRAKEPQDQTWIMYRRAVDLGYLPLRDYWKEFVDSETSKVYRFAHFFPDAQDDVLEIITRLEGAFPRLTSDRAASAPPEAPTHSPILPDPPKGFKLERLLSDDGKHKIAYIGACTHAEELGDFSVGEVYVLKRYREVNQQRQRALKDCVLNIFKLKSNFLTETTILNGPKQGDLWLVERLWVSDLLRLVQQDGLRRDMLFLLSMGQDLFRGLVELANKNIRHGDLKLENCGVVAGPKNQLVFQIGDFGTATGKPDNVPTEGSGMGTLKSRPPELLLSTGSRKVGTQSDVWSLAATIFAAAMGRYPFVRLTYKPQLRDEMAKEISENLSAKVEELDQTIRTEIPPILGDILRPCLVDKFENRPSAEDVYRALSRAHEKCTDGKKQNVELLWQRALDLVELARVERAGDALQSKLQAECNRLSELDAIWIPTALKTAMSKTAMSHTAATT